ncbi:MAG: hypothetical protein DBX40_06895 [Clostridiales bacterium]|nr:MAG: hypothetical protein DBX40_06895 [Clostridiales bacterium]
MIIPYPGCLYKRGKSGAGQVSLPLRTESPQDPDVRSSSVAKHAEANGTAAIPAQPGGIV